MMEILRTFMKEKNKRGEKLYGYHWKKIKYSR